MWREPDTTFGTNGGPDRVWGSGPSDVWAAGGSSVVHWDGNSWSSAVSPPSGFVGFDFNGVWGSGTDRVWVVGQSGAIISFPP